MIRTRCPACAHITLQDIPPLTVGHVDCECEECGKEIVVTVAVKHVVKEVDGSWLAKERAERMMGR